MPWVAGLGPVALAAVGAVFLRIGALIRRVDAGAEDRAARLAFATWWLSASLAAVVGATALALALADARHVALFLTLAQVVAFANALAVGGLLGYATMLYRPPHGFPVVVGVLVVTVFAIHSFSTLDPVPVAVDPSNGVLGFERATNPSTALVALATIAHLAPIAWAVAIFVTVATKLRDSTQRYRLTVLGAGIAAWGVGGAITHFAFLSNASALGTAGLIAAALGAFVCLAAYHPPVWVQARLRVSPLVLTRARRESE